MRNDVEKVVSVAFEAVVEAPVVVDARLVAPHASNYVELLGLQGRMAPVTEQVRDLLAEELLNLRWALRNAATKGSVRTARMGLLFQGTHHGAG